MNYDKINNINAMAKNLRNTPANEQCIAAAYGFIAQALEDIAGELENMKFRIFGELVDRAHAKK